MWVNRKLFYSKYTHWTEVFLHWRFWREVAASLKVDSIISNVSPIEAKILTLRLFLYLLKFCSNNEHSCGPKVQYSVCTMSQKCKRRWGSSNSCSTFSILCEGFKLTSLGTARHSKFHDYTTILFPYFLFMTTDFVNINTTCTVSWILKHENWTD